MPRPTSIRNRATLQRENQRLHKAAAEAAALARTETVSAGAVARAHWPQWATGILAAVASLAVAGIGGFVALSGTHYGAEQNRAAESREHRAEVYADYLAKARTYGDALDDDKIKQWRWEHAEGPAERDAASSAAMASFVKAIADGEAFRRQADLVFVYGSDAAWAAHEKVRTGINPEENDAAPGVAALRRERLLMDFQSVFCREAAAEPRSGCG